MIASLVVSMAAALAATAEAPAGSAATTAPTPAAVAPAPEKAKPNPLDEVVCRQIEETGTRLGGHRVCMKRRDWLEASRRARESLESQTARQGVALSKDK